MKTQCCKLNKIKVLSNISDSEKVFTWFEMSCSCLSYFSWSCCIWKKSPALQREIIALCSVKDTSLVFRTLFISWNSQAGLIQVGKCIGRMVTWQVFQSVWCLQVLRLCQRSWQPLVSKQLDRWVTWPEQPKGAKDEGKRPGGP